MAIWTARTAPARASCSRPRVALEPDNDRARDGLHQVGQAELAQADAALQAGQLAQAAQQAAVARELLGGGSDVDRLDSRSATAHATQVKTVDLVDQAQQAMAAGKLDGTAGAGALYQQVLQRRPGQCRGRAWAGSGRLRAGGAGAPGAGCQGRCRAPSASIEQLAALQPNNGALPALRALQAQGRKQDSQRAGCGAQAGAGRPARRAHRAAAGDDTALAHFKAALALDPDNAQARAGLGRVAQAMTVQASAAIDAGDADAGHAAARPGGHAGAEIGRSRRGARAAGQHQPQSTATTRHPARHAAPRAGRGRAVARSRARRWRGWSQRAQVAPAAATS